MRNLSRMKTRDSGFVLLLILFLITSCAWAQSEDELIRGAKKEGKVVFWSSMRIDDSKALAAGFEARYPFIKVDIFRAGGEQIVNRAMAEHLAGKTTYDVLNAFALKVLQNKGMLQPYTAPEAAHYPVGFKDPQNYWVSLYSGYNVIGYNTKLVPKAEAPRNWDDLLNPRWKGKLGMDKDADDWLAAIMDYYGDERGKQIARSLGAQQLNIRKGRTLVSQLVTAGEFPVQIDAHHHEAVALKKAGAPIDYLFPEPFVPVKAASAFVLAARPPHPYAAALLVDFMLSKKGQEIAYRQTRWPAHKDLATGATDEVGNRKTLVPDADKWGARFEELVQLTGLLER